MKTDALAIFEANKGVLRMSQALARGVSRFQLDTLISEGKIERIDRGLYRLSALPPVSNPDLVLVALKYPKAIVCLISALSFYNLTTQIPHAVHIAVLRGSRLPKTDYPPLQTYQFSDAMFSEGITSHTIDGVEVHMYSPEKTLVDYFRFRNQIGMDIFLEALKSYRAAGKPDWNKLMQYAKTCRVQTMITPYLEANL